MGGIRIVLVGPEYQINLGHAARIAANFGHKKLYLVEPGCKIGPDARKYAKHATGVLENSVICKSLGEALEGCNLVVGTTGILRRHRGTIRNPIPLREFSKMGLPPRTAILFGREGIGLTREEIDRCDMLVSIESSREYPIMNITHAMGIVLYSLSSMEYEREGAATENERRQLERQFGELVGIYSRFLKTPHKISMAWKRVIGRSSVTGIEARCMLGILRRAARDLKRGKG